MRVKRETQTGSKETKHTALQYGVWGSHKAIFSQFHRSLNVTLYCNCPTLRDFSSNICPLVEFAKILIFGIGIHPTSLLGIWFAWTLSVPTLILDKATCGERRWNHLRNPSILLLLLSFRFTMVVAMSLEERKNVTALRPVPYNLCFYVIRNIASLFYFWDVTLNASPCLFVYSVKQGLALFSLSKCQIAT